VDITEEVAEFTWELVQKVFNIVKREHPEIFDDIHNKYMDTCIEFANDPRNQEDEYDQKGPVNYASEMVANLWTIIDEEYPEIVGGLFSRYMDEIKTDVREQNIELEFQRTYREKK
jgi:hypothetical protein